MNTRDTLESLEVLGYGLHVDIVLLDPVTGSEANLTFAKGAGGYGQPSWSKDGTRLAYRYAYFSSAGPTPPASIHVMNPDGTNDQTLTLSTTVDLSPTWSPDGQWIAFVDENDLQYNLVYAVKSDGSDASRVFLFDLRTPMVHLDWRPAPVTTTVITDCAAPELQTLTSVPGDLVIGDPACGALSLPSLTTIGGGLSINDATLTTFEAPLVDTVGGDINVTNNAELVELTLDSVTTVGGDLDISGNARLSDLDLPSLGDVDGNLTIFDNDDLTGVSADGLTSVGGDITISDNAELIDLNLADLGDVGDDFTVSDNPELSIVTMPDIGTVGGDVDISVPQGSLSVPDIDVSGNASLATLGDLSAQTPDGSTDITLFTAVASMTVTIPTGAFTTPVPFSVSALAGDDLLEQPGTSADFDVSVAPLVAYRFVFGTPVLQQAATLTFTVALDQLTADGRATLVQAIASDTVSLAVKGDAAGDTYDVYSRCPADQLAAGCSAITLLGSNGQTVADIAQAAFARFSGLTSHFSSFAVVLIKATSVDLDGDGVVDASDTCVNEAEDLDGLDDLDGCPEDDADGDSVLDTADAFPLDPAESVDTDHDGTGNNADTDDDNDGVADAGDAFPLNAAEAVDTDHDGTGNNADADDDGDGGLDGVDCQPLNPAVHRGASEVPGNGVDDNCDGRVDETPSQARFSGFLDPYEPPPSAFKAGRTIPLRWQYVNDLGAAINSAGAMPTVSLSGPVSCGDVTGGELVDVNVAAKSGYQYDAATSTWGYNWKASVASGCYYVQITSPTLPVSPRIPIRIK